MNPARTARLRDSRTLAYAEWGDPEGFPVIECHGNPGCRVLVWDEAVPARLGVRLITVDRPGLGLSSPQPGRTIAGWADDAAQLVDVLELGRFGVLGYSVGGAYACACAERLGERVAVMALVGSIAPLDRPGAFEELGRAIEWRLARDHPAIARAGVRAQALLARLPPSVVRRLSGLRLPAPDRSVLAGDPGIVERGAAMGAEAVRQGPDGLIEDLRVAMRPWGVDLGAIAVPTTVWQGGRDGSIPVSWAEYLARSIPGARLRLLPGEGHLMIAPRLAPILEELVHEKAAG